jgi:hypothetical protein
VTPGQQVTAVLWHGDLVEVESDGTVAVDSGSPDIGARNRLALAPREQRFPHLSNAGKSSQRTDKKGKVNIDQEFVLPHAA